MPKREPPRRRPQMAGERQLRAVAPRAPVIGAAITRSTDAATLESDSTGVESDSNVILLFEHDLFGKPASTFPDHALAARRRDGSLQCGALARARSSRGSAREFPAARYRASRH